MWQPAFRREPLLPIRTGFNEAKAIKGKFIPKSKVFYKITKIWEELPVPSPGRTSLHTCATWLGEPRLRVEAGDLSPSSPPVPPVLCIWLIGQAGLPQQACRFSNPPIYTFIHNVNPMNQ